MAPFQPAEVTLLAFGGGSKKGKGGKKGREEIFVFFAPFAFFASLLLTHN
jgi:hypothetical protein